MTAKKILILTESIDATADKVCYWLSYFNQEFVRFNTDKEALWVAEVEIVQSEVTITIGHHSGIYNIKDFKLIWFRRGQLINYIQPVINNVMPEDVIVNSQINNHIQQELITLNDFVYTHIPKETVQINNPLKYNINKLECLYEAAHIGLKTPHTLVTRKKDRLKKFVEDKKVVITKNIKDILVCHSDNFFMMQSTRHVEDKYISRVGSSFFPSLFQQAISKKADVRVFFILGKVFTTIVFDYMNPNNVDFRASQVNQVVLPYNLPKHIEKMLLKLADKMGLESGSADFVLTEKNELYFLEINPVGQVDFVSYLANLYIEKEIAKTLINSTND